MSDATVEPDDEPSDHFAFTKLVVADLDAAVAFYSATFDLTESARVQASIAGRAIDEVLLLPTRTGGAMLVLLHFLDTVTAAGGEVILGMTTADIDRVVARAVASGGRVVQEPYASADAGGMRVGFVADPEGHLIEVVEALRTRD